MERTRNSESGVAMVLVVTVLAALLAVGAIGLSLQLDSSKSASLVKDSRSSLYCAEAGIAKARLLLTANRDLWNNLLDADTTNDPVWYPITGDIDADTVDDYTVTVRDDGDGDDDPTTDFNDTIIVESVCTKFDTAPATVLEVISMLGQGFGYRNQSGQGAGNTGNAN